jgi:hypothetical protein
MARQEGGECSIGRVRARLAWLAGAVGVAGAVVYRKLLRAPAVGENPRAAELRQRLDESRAIVEEREEFEAAETTVDAAEETGPEARRRDVHERGRAAAEKMRGRSAE